MPASEGTLTAADVAAELGVPSDQRMVDITAATEAYVRARKFNPDGIWWDPDVHRGAVLYAAGLYLSRTTPEGMAGYDPTFGQSGFELVFRAKQLLRLDVGFA